MTLVRMSRPPVQNVAATRHTVSSPTLARTAANKVRPNYPAKIAILAALAVASLGVLTGCQGVSAGGSSNQQQTATLSLNAATLQFGSVAAGNRKSLTVTATNSGPAPVGVSAVSFSTKYFSLASPSVPMTIAAGQSTPISIEFAPNAAGTFSATVTISSNATNTSNTVSLSGTGTGTSTSGDLGSNPGSESFGSVTVGSQLSQTFTLTNSGSASVDISQASITGAGFQLSGITAPLTLGSSQSTTFKVVFAPQAAGSASGSVTITSNASNPSLTVGLSGTGVTPADLAPSPASLSFGTVTVGNNSSLLETVTNTGGSSATISQVSISGTGFTLSGVTTPITLGAGQGTSFHVIFTPTSANGASGNVVVTSNASNPSLSISLSGTGTSTPGQLAVSPSTLALGSVVVGTSGTASGSLTASGASVTVTSAGTNNSAFSLSGLTLPATIPAGQSVPFTVTFSPQSTGAASATLSFSSNAQNSPTTETLTGTATAAPTHDVALSWNASTSPDISGYNVYRAVYANSACGSFSKINPSLTASTLYTDSVVVDGTVYCYATTAVTSSNEESGYSNIVSDVQIPAP